MGKAIEEYVDCIHLSFCLGKKVSFLKVSCQKSCKNLARNPPYPHKTVIIVANRTPLQLYFCSLLAMASTSLYVGCGCLILLLDKPLEIPYAGKRRFRHLKIVMKLASLYDRIHAIADHVYVQPGLCFPLPQCSIELRLVFLRAIGNGISLPGLGEEIHYSSIKSLPLTTCSY